VKPAPAARSKAVSAAAIHLTSSNPNRGQTFKEAKRISAPIPRSKRPRASTPTPTASPPPASAQKRSRGGDDDEDYTPGGSAGAAQGSAGYDAAPVPRAPIVYTTPELSDEHKVVFKHLATNPHIQLSEPQAEELAMGIQLRHDTLVAKLQPVFNKAVNELIRWAPRGQENYFKYKITLKWAREHAPDYLHRIENPMDLRRIQSRTTTKNPDDMYASLAEFEADVRLIFTNAAAYNSEDSLVAKAAAAMVKFLYQKMFGRMEKELATATKDARLSEVQRILTSMRAEHMRSKQQAAPAAAVASGVSGAPAASSDASQPPV